MRIFFESAWDGNGYRPYYTVYYSEWESPPFPNSELTGVVFVDLLDEHCINNNSQLIEEDTGDRVLPISEWRIPLTKIKLDRYKLYIYPA